MDVGQNVSEKKEEEQEENSEEADSEASSSEDDEGAKKAVQALTGRKVTLTMLMEDGIIEAGLGVLSIDYLGQKFEADLLPNGKIKWHGSQDEFGTPSAWALHCKRLVSTVKRSGCGWASVKYKNKKLDIWKSIWARKHRQSSSSKSPQVSPGSATTDPPWQGSPSKPRPPTALTSGRLSTSTAIADYSLGPTAIATGTSSSSSPSASTAPQQKPQIESTSTVLQSEGEEPEQKTFADPPPSLPHDKTSQHASSLTQDSSQTDTTQTHADTKAGQESSQVASTPDGSSRSTASIGSSDVTPSIESVSPAKKSKPEDSSYAITLDDKGWLLYQQQQLAQKNKKKRQSVPYSSLGPRGLDVDPFTLIKCVDFDCLGKIQPFTVSISSNTVLLMDFHCHLTKSEVVGYLGGRWDCQRQHLSIEQAFPAKCRLGDKDRASGVEEEIRGSMRQKSLMVVGWYHSHPSCAPDPTVRDLDCQMAYQLRMRGSGAIYLPCVGFILAPFEKYPLNQDSKLQAFWVMPNLEHPTSFNIPMQVTYSVVRDLSLTEDLLTDMKTLCEFYNGAVDKVNPKEQWGEAITYLDKLKVSLRTKLPEDQLESNTFLDYVQQLLVGEAK